MVAIQSSLCAYLSNVNLFSSNRPWVLYSYSEKVWLLLYDYIELTAVSDANRVYSLVTLGDVPPLSTPQGHLDSGCCSQGSSSMPVHLPHCGILCVLYTAIVTSTVTCVY